MNLCVVSMSCVSIRANHCLSKHFYDILSDMTKFVSILHYRMEPNGTLVRLSLTRSSDALFRRERSRVRHSCTVLCDAVRTASLVRHRIDGHRAVQSDRALATASVIATVIGSNH